MENKKLAVEILQDGEPTGIEIVSDSSEAFGGDGVYDTLTYLLNKNNYSFITRVIRG